MLEPVSVLLKFGFLLVLYLFLLWVSRSALRDLRRDDAMPVPSRRTSSPAMPEGTALHAAASGLGGGLEETEALLRVESGAGLEPGSAFDLVGGAVIGRGEQVDIHLEDTFASSRHAKFSWQGSVVVLEDLGSTNGTYLNGELLRGPQPIHVGDRIRIGDTEFSMATDD
jgi:FHA domain